MKNPSTCAIVTAVITLVLAACSTAPVTISSTIPITPEQAIYAAEKAAPSGVEGVFVLQVRATGRRESHIYLDSEPDYQDRRNLTIDIFPSAAWVLKQEYGVGVDQYLKGKKIVVSGMAQRVKVDLYTNPIKSDKYYFQTHVDVDRAEQIRIVP